MNKLFKKLIPFICIAAAVLMIVLASTNLSNRNKYIKATATIKDINVTEDTTDIDETKYDYQVVVTFTVDNEEITAILGEYNASMNEGDEIEIMYNPDKPTEIMSSSMTAPIFMFGFAALCIVAAVISFFKFWIR